jgi:flagellar biogenesis protein FliO
VNQAVGTALATGSDPGISLVRVFLSLFLCLGLALLVAYWLKRRTGFVPMARAQRRLRLVERTSLSPTAHMALVEADGREFLIVTGSGPAAIHELHGEAPSPAVLPESEAP